jgi:hypothetical protein
VISFAQDRNGDYRMKYNASKSDYRQNENSGFVKGGRDGKIDHNIFKPSQRTEVVLCSAVERHNGSAI